jgi:acyl-CoA thioesterase-1
MARPSAKVATSGRRMAHRARRGPLHALALPAQALVPAWWRTRSQSTGTIAATTSDGEIGASGMADPASKDGSTKLSGATGPYGHGEITRLTRKYMAGSVRRSRASELRPGGLEGGLERLARRALPREAHRRELAGVLVLVLAACALSAGLPGVWAAHSDPSEPGAGLAANLAPVDPTGSASPSITSETATPTPSPTEIPSPSDSPTPLPTPAPTKTPVKAPAPAKVYSFVALGDSLTSGYGDPGPSWPSRLDSQDAHLRLLHNAGVPGNLTSDMRARLDSDVLAYKPEVLFVMGGTNDIGHNISAAATIANLRAIIVAAKAKGIKVIMMTIPPDSYPAQAGAINYLNSQIIHLANSYVLAYVDVHAVLATSDGVYVRKFTVDGLHFSALGAQTVANAVQARVKRYGM